MDKKLSSFVHQTILFVECFDWIAEREQNFSFESNEVANFFSFFRKNYPKKRRAENILNLIHQKIGEPEFFGGKKVRPDFGIEA